MLNDAGEWFWGSHEWNYAIRQAFIDVRAQISFTSADWAASTKTITKTGAFADYTWLAGDQIEITAATGGRLGWYEIASKVSADAITLTESIKSTNISGAVSATMHLWGCALPSDFMNFLPGMPTIAPGFAQSFDFADMSEVQQWRALFTGGSTAAYIGALSFGKDTLNGGARTPRLEIAPEIVAGRASAFSISYRSKWPRVTTSTTAFELPVWCEPAFKEVLRAFARGYQEEDVATVDERLMRIMAGPLYDQALRQDGMLQNSWGQIKGGAVKTSASRGPFNNFDIQDPT